MKTKIITTTLTILSLVIILAFCYSNQEAGKTNDSLTQETIPPDDEPVTVTFEGKIDHKIYDKNAKASVIINRIPQTEAKFNEMYEQAAVEPHGAVVMALVAFEIFRKNPVIGEKCMARTLYQKSGGDETRLLGGDLHFMKDRLRDTCSSLYMPYAPMGYYEGATPANNYTPNVPYKVNFGVHQNVKYLPLQSAQALTISLRIKSYGEDWNGNPNTEHNTVVLKPAGEKYFVIFGGSWKDLLTRLMVPIKK